MKINVLEYMLRSDVFCCICCFAGITAQTLLLDIVLCIPTVIYVIMSMPLFITNTVRFPSFANSNSKSAQKARSEQPL